jgi:hypothetical protein
MNFSASTSRKAGAMEWRSMPYSAKWSNVQGSLPLSLPPWWAISISSRSRIRRALWLNTRNAGLSIISIVRHPNWPEILFLVT